MLIEPKHVNKKHEAISDNPETAALVEAYRVIVQHFQRDNDLTEAELQNMADTPQRAAKALNEMTSTKTRIAAELEHILQTGFPTDVAEDELPPMVTQGPVEIFSFCPHHLLPVYYNAYVSYIPKRGGAVLGLSKLARIAVELGKRPVLQEELARDIAGVLHYTPSGKFPAIETAGSAVMLVGKHSCMSCRGVRQHALTTSTEIRGAYQQDGVEMKFLKSIEHIANSKLHDY